MSREEIDFTGGYKLGLEQPEAASLPVDVEDWESDLEAIAEATQGAEPTEAQAAEPVEGQPVESEAAEVFPSPNVPLEGSGQSNASGDSTPDLLKIAQGLQAEDWKKHYKLTEEVAGLERQIADHHAAMVRLAAERKRHKAAMDAAGEEREEAIRELDEITADLTADDSVYRYVVRSRAALAEQQQAAAPASLAESPAIEKSASPATEVQVSSHVAAAPVAQDPALSAPLSVLKISPGRLEALQDAEASPGRRCSVVADLETLIREGRLQHVRRFGPAAVDAVTDALIDWRQKNPVPTPDSGPALAVSPNVPVASPAPADDDEATSDGDGPEEVPSDGPGEPIPAPEDLAEDPEESAWWTQGAIAAQRDQPSFNNPHSPGTRAHRLWDRGWQENFTGNDLIDE